MIKFGGKGGDLVECVDRRRKCRVCNESIGKFDTSVYRFLYVSFYFFVLLDFFFDELVVFFVVLFVLPFFVSLGDAS